MSLPTSEPLPNDINDLPPARQRHIRRQPQSASLAERQILLDSLLQLIAPTLDFFLLSLLGAIAVGTSILFDEPAVLLVALVLLPFHKPVFGLALLPITLKVGFGSKSLLSLLIFYSLVFSMGVLAGWFRPSSSLTHLNIFRFSSLYWLDLSILAVSVLFCTLILFRQGRLPQLAGVLLSYALMIPICVAGFGLAIGQHQLWPGALILGIAHLGIAILLSIFGFLLIGFGPKRIFGWLMTLIILGITLASLAGSLNLANLPLTALIGDSPTPETLLTKTPSPTVQITETAMTATATATSTHTPTPIITFTITHTATFTPTTEPTSYFAMVDTVIGAVIRESPAFNAAVVGYANDGDKIEILQEITPEGSSRWFQVRLATGETGWLLGSLVITQTPEP